LYAFSANITVLNNCTKDCLLRSRQTTSELSECVYFGSHKKDGGRIIRSTIADNKPS